MNAISAKHFTFSRLTRALVMLCASAAFLAGCVQMTPVPNYARSGDTLVLGLGGIQRNLQGYQSLAPADFLITVTDSANATYTLTAQAPFKAFPDYGSQMNYQTISGNSAMAPAPIQPFDGGWFIPVKLAAPSGSTLAVGPATISITSPTGKLVNNQSTGNYGIYPNYLKEGNLTAIPVEIIAGTTNSASPASMDYNNQFRAYIVSNVPSINVAPSTLTGISAVGGMQMAIKYTPSGAKVPMAVPYNHNPSINLQQNTVDNGDGTRTLNVVLTAPQGFAATSTPLKPSLRDLNIKVISFNGTNFQIVSSKFIDASGNVIPSLTAVIGPLVL